MVQLVTAHVPVAVAAVAAATRLMLPSTARTMRLERTSARNWSYQADSVISCRRSSKDAAQQGVQRSGYYVSVNALEKTASATLPPIPSSGWSHGMSQWASKLESVNALRLT